VDEQVVFECCILICIEEISKGMSSVNMFFFKNHLPASLRSFGLISVCLFASFTMSESLVLYCEEKVKQMIYYHPRK
jgi:hypothetical protein